MESVKMLMNVNKAHVIRPQYVKILQDHLPVFVLMDYWVIHMQKDVTIQTVVPLTMNVQKVLFVIKIIAKTHAKIIKYAVVMQLARSNIMKFNVNAL
jgi:hypothetical protein